MPELTIAVPTYDRNRLLLRGVSGLLPQLDSRCRLLILDNHSPEPVEQTLAAVLAQYPGVDCRIVRHPHNIGGNANIVRCFELCETEWLWVLGDDDEVDPQAIATIFEVIAADPGLLYANFAAEGHPRSRDFVTTGPEDFARGIDAFLHSNFISTCLFNHARIKPQIHFGYQFAYSCAPQFLMVLMSLGPRDRCLFSSKYIVHWAIAAPEQQGPLSMAWLGFMIILEAPLRPALRRLAATAITGERPALRVLARVAFYTGVHRQEFETSKFVYDHMTYRLFYFDSTPLTRVKIFAYRLPLVFPRAFGWLNRAAARLTGRKIDPFPKVQRDR
jgi:glycosyltransferase involved in cell wall biosynthesis